MVIPDLSVSVGYHLSSFSSSFLCKFDFCLVLRESVVSIWDSRFRIFSYSALQFFLEFRFPVSELNSTKSDPQVFPNLELCFLSYQIVLLCCFWFYVSDILPVSLSVFFLFVKCVHINSFCFRHSLLILIEC